jgi:hypothetical protein
MPTTGRCSGGRAPKLPRGGVDSWGAGSDCGMGDARTDLQEAEAEVRRQAATLRELAQRFRLSGFLDLADGLKANAVALQETADIIAGVAYRFAPPDA